MKGEICFWARGEGGGSGDEVAGCGGADGGCGGANGGVVVVVGATVVGEERESWMRKEEGKKRKKNRGVILSFHLNSDIHIIT